MVGQYDVNFYRHYKKLLNFFYAGKHSSFSDIGSNIGAYTLASRAMDNPVISVDMDPHNQALLFNSLGKITI